MSKSLETSRYQLIDRIMFSESASEVRQIIRKAVEDLKTNQVHAAVIFHFIDSVVEKMGEYDNGNLYAHQKMMVVAARMECKKQKAGLDFGPRK